MQVVNQPKGGGSMGEMDYTMSSFDGFWMLVQITLFVSVFLISFFCVFQDKSKEKNKKGGN